MYKITYNIKSIIPIEKVYCFMRTIIAIFPF